MSTIDIADTARLTVRLKETATSEIFQFGVGVSQREPDVWSDFLDRIDEWCTTDLPNVVSGATAYQLVYAEYGTSGFTGYHQKAEKVINRAGNSSAILPPQNAVCVSLLNDEDTDISLKRRRGRMYLGLVRVSWLDGNGKLTSTPINDITVAIQNLTDRIQDTVPVAGLPDGMLINSLAEGKGITVSKIGIGAAVDTQRRRRQKVNEAIVYQPADT